LRSLPRLSWNRSFGLLPATLAQPGAAPPVTLAVRLGTDHQQFRPGEIIPIELEFNSASPNRFSVDGAMGDASGRLTVDEFVIDRIDDVADPMARLVRGQRCQALAFFVKVCSCAVRCSLTSIRGSS